MRDKAGLAVRPRAIALLAAAAAAAALVFAGLVASRAVHRELASLEPSPSPVGTRARAAGDAWLAAARDVSLETAKGATLRGWSFSSRNGAAVLLVDGSGADRTQLLPEARILTQAGYGVLVFDQPGVGESGGSKRRGDEQDFLRVAVDALSSAPDVRPERVGAFGFSTGAAVLADVAARDTRIRAVALAGCYPSTEEHVRRDFRRWGPLSELPALWAARWAGVVELRPIESVVSIAPRPLLLIAGDRDAVVPPESAERLFAAAGVPKELWIVHGAAHGDYAKVAAEQYARKLVAFFDDALAGAGARARSGGAKLDFRESMP